MVSDCVRMALRNLARHLPRTLLTMTGIIIGTCSVIAVWSVGSGGRGQIVDVFRTFGVSGLAVSAPAGAASAEFTLEDLDYLEKNVDEITAAMPLIYESISAGLTSASSEAFALGVGDNVVALSAGCAKYGRGFTFAEIQARARVCMIDSELAQKIYRRENIVGKTVRLGVSGATEDFTVIGVISKDDSAVGSLIGSYVTDLVYVPYSTFFELSGDENFQSFVAAFADGTNQNTVRKKVFSLLEAKNSVTGYRYEDLSGQQTKIDSAVGTVTVVIAAIAGVSLVVGGVGVMTIMLVAVNERKREIGIKKALGATRGDIMAEFMAEALVISLSGGITGIALGYALSLLSRPLLGIEAVFSADISIYSLLFCAAIGIIFSVYPAKKAAGLAPIDCLKYE